MTPPGRVVFGKSDGREGRVGNAAVLVVGAAAARHAATGRHAAVQVVSVTAHRRLRAGESRSAMTPSSSSATSSTSTSSSSTSSSSSSASVHAVVEIPKGPGRSFGLSRDEAGSLGDGRKLGSLGRVAIDRRIVVVVTIAGAWNVLVSGGWRGMRVVGVEDGVFWYRGRGGRGEDENWGLGPRLGRGRGGRGRNTGWVLGQGSFL